MYISKKDRKREQVRKSCAFKYEFLFNFNFGIFGLKSYTDEMNME
jgi:hypothetical protein